MISRAATSGELHAWAVAHPSGSRDHESRHRLLITRLRHPRAERIPRMLGRIANPFRPRGDLTNHEPRGRLAPQYFLGNRFATAAIALSIPRFVAILSFGPSTL